MTRDLGPISPELCLVDPELARRARRKLPEVAKAPASTRAAPVAELFPTPREEPRALGLELPKRMGGRRARALRLLRSTALLGLGAALVPTLLAVLMGLFPPERPRLESRVSPDAEAGLRPTPGLADSAGTEPAAGAGSAREAVAPTPKPRSRGRPDEREAKRGAESSAARGVPAALRARLIDGLVALSGSRGLAWASAAFGPPTGRERRGEYCSVTWSRLGLTIVLTATDGPDPCERGEVAGGVVRWRRWRTSKGLRVGDSLEELRSRYPGAQARPDGWWWLLVVRRPVLGELRLQPLLSAHVRDGRVDQFVLG